MIVECFLISAFVSEGTKLSTRTLFLDVVKASIDFLLEMDIQSTAASPAEDLSVKKLQFERKYSISETRDHHQILQANVSLDVTPRGKKIIDLERITTESPEE